MDRGQKKFGHGHGLPPIPVPPSFYGRNNIGDASSEAEATVEPETENQASQDPEHDTKKRRRSIYTSFLYIHIFISIIFYKILF